MAHGRCAPALAFVLLGAVGIAQAAPTAEQRADTYANAGNYELAAQAYVEAYAADPRPSLICNAGVAYKKAKNLPRAQLYLGECLLHGSSLDPMFVDNVRANLVAIEAQLRAGDYTPVDFTVVPANALITDDDGDGRAPVTPRLVWMASRTHRVEVRADGYVEQIVTVDAHGKDVLPIHVALEPVKSAVPPLPPHDEVKPLPPPPPPSRPSIALPIATTAASVALAVFAGVAYSVAQHDADRAHFALTIEAFETDSDSVSAWNRGFGFAGGAAIVGGAVSYFLWTRYLHGRGHMELTATSDGAMLQLTTKY